MEIRGYLRVGRGGGEVEVSARKSSARAMATSAEVGKEAAAGAEPMSPARGQVLVVGEEAVAAVAGVGFCWGIAKSLGCLVPRRCDLGFFLNF